MKPIQSAIRKNDDVVAGGNRRAGLLAQFAHGTFQPGRTLVDFVKDRQGDRFKGLPKPTGCNPWLACRQVP